MWGAQPTGNAPDPTSRCSAAALSVKRGKPQRDLSSLFGTGRQIVFEAGTKDLVEHGVSNSNGWLVTYLQLLSPDGAPAYKGEEGRRIRGIEIMPTLEQLF
jgi:hypothetical protein